MCIILISIIIEVDFVASILNPPPQTPDPLTCYTEDLI